MRPNEYLVLTECVEEGVAYGWNRAHKHCDNPTPDQIKDAIEQAVMNSICGYFYFDSDEDRE